MEMLSQNSRFTEGNVVGQLSCNSYTFTSPEEEGAGFAKGVPGDII